MKKDSRPRFLNFLHLKFPITAIVSILHRISGVFIFLMLPFLLWVWQEALSSEAHFEAWRRCFESNAMKVGIALFLLAIAYHLLAGIRHLLMDCGWGETKQGAKWSASGVFVLTALFGVVLARWLWGV